jgi:endonuclease/exonuclease/phosphatase family metal-dependent hydrolase
MARKRRKSRGNKALSTIFALLVIFGIGFVNFYSGKFDRHSVWEWLSNLRGPRVEQREATVPIPKVPQTIRLGTFNIQVFGKSKLSQPEVMGVLADVVRQFDVLAIQEIRTQDDTHLDQFLRMINQGGRQYRGVIGERLGRTSSTEQYAFIYDSEMIEVVEGSVYTIADPHDRLHREPLIGTFRVRGPPTPRPFSFRLINIHTDPDETKTELDALADVFAVVQQSPGEDDTILLGDLNVDTQHFGRLAYRPGILPVIQQQFTNTRGTSQMDNIVFDRRFTVEMTGNAGVMNLMEMYGLTEDEALKVSDHLPVWSDFSIYEGRTGPLVRNQETLSN